MKHIIYFGYGANKNLEMIEAIVGRKPKGMPGILEGYELFVQSWDEIEKNIRKRLESSWSSDFRTYCIRHGKGNVSGTIWFLTKKERESVRRWEMVGSWYTQVPVEIKKKNGEIIKGETEIVDDPKIGELVNGMRYPAFLNSKKKMLDVARKDRLR